MDAHLDQIKQSSLNGELVVITGSTLYKQNPWKRIIERCLSFLAGSWDALEKYIPEIREREVATEAFFRLGYRYFGEDMLSLCRCLAVSPPHHLYQKLAYLVSNKRIHKLATADVDNQLPLALENLPEEDEKANVSYLNGNIEDSDSLTKSLQVDEHKFLSLGEEAKKFFQTIKNEEKAKTILIAGLSADDYCWKEILGKIQQLAKAQKNIFWLAPKETIPLKHLAAIGSVQTVSLPPEEVLAFLCDETTASEESEQPQIDEKKVGEWLEDRPELDFLEFAADLLNYVVSRSHSHEIYQYLLESSQKENDHSKSARCYRAIGRILFEQGRMEKAIASHVRAVESWRLAEDFLEMAREYMFVGDAYWHGSALEKALQSYGEALVLYREKSDLPGISDATGKLALLCDSDEDYETARGYYIESLQAKKKLSDDQGTVTSLLNLGATLIKNQEWEQAKEHLHEAMALCKEKGELFGSGDISQHLGLVYMNLQDFAQARHHYEEVYELYKKGQDKLSQTFVYCNLGHVCARLEDYDEAIKHYEGALEYYEKMGDWQHLAAVYNNLGFINSNREEYADAEEYFSRAAEIFAALGDVYNLIRTHANLARIYTIQGELENAAECYRANIEMLSQLGEREDLASTLIALAMLQLQSQQFEEAISNLQEAIDIYASLGLAKEKEDTIKILNTVEARIASQ